MAQTIEFGTIPVYKMLGKGHLDGRSCRSISPIHVGRLGMRKLTPRNAITRQEARFGLTACAFIICLGWALPTAAQEDCANVVAEVQRLYEVGRTAEMIPRLDGCLPDGIANLAPKVQAYRYLALAHIAEDHQPEAKEAVEKLLDLNENFVPDPSTDLSRFIDLVDEGKLARLQARKRKSKKRRWLFIGGGTLVAGAVTAAIITLTGSSAPRLPDPPLFPEN